MTQKSNQLNGLPLFCIQLLQTIFNFVNNKNSTVPINAPTLSQQPHVYDPIMDHWNENSTPHNEFDGALRVLTEQVSLSRLKPPPPLL